MDLKRIKVGDDVDIECWSSQGDDTVRRVTDITTKYNEDTGKPYGIIWCDNWGFKRRGGEAITPPLHYSIVSKVFKKGGKS